MRIEVLQPHGFCAGVTGALGKAHKLAESGEPRIYCLHELVHNELVVGDMRRRGFVFVDDPGDVPEGAVVLFPAHGTSPAVRAKARARRLRVVDATCPFVERVHKAARDFAEKGLGVVIVGKATHAEVRGILGEVPGAIVVGSVAEAEALPDPGADKALGVVSQTTMNADEVGEVVAALRRRFRVESTAAVCGATKERQDAVKAFKGDALLVLGSKTSSNTRRLCEVSRVRTYLAGTMDEVRALDLQGVELLGVTSGASTPEAFLKEAVGFLRSACAGA